MRSMLINKLDLFHADYRMCLIYNIFILSLCLAALVGWFFVCFAHHSAQTPGITLAVQLISFIQPEFLVCVSKPVILIKFVNSDKQNILHSNCPDLQRRRRRRKKRHGLCIYIYICST